MLWISLALADPCARVDGPCSVVKRTSTPIGMVFHVKHHADPAATRDFGDPGSCIQEVWWLEPAKGEPKPLLEVCNDGYGASGVGEDQVRIDGTVFEHSQYGGSAMRWSFSNAIDLATGALVREQSGSMYFLAEQQARFDYRTFSGTSMQSYCTPAGEDELVQVEHAVIPRFDAPGYDAASTALGACSLEVDSRQGPLVHGRAGAAADASLKVAMVGDTLVVEVRDDTWVPQAKRWIHADHLEIWASAAIPWQECLKGDLDAKQWGVMLDGSVHRAHGEPPPIQAVVHDFDGGRRFVITGLDEPERLAVVYSDSDDGVRQERLIGTSKVTFGDGTTLGTPYRVRPERAVCSGSGALKPKSTYVPKGPLLQGTL